LVDNGICAIAASTYDDDVGGMGCVFARVFGKGGGYGCADACLSAIVEGVVGESGD